MTTSQTINWVTRIARFSWILPAIPLTFIYHATAWYWVFALGLASGVLATLSWKLVSFAMISQCLFGDHIVKCSNCGSVSHPGASSMLIAVLEKMQSACNCAKEVKCSSSHGS